MITLFASYRYGEYSISMFSSLYHNYILQKYFGFWSDPAVLIAFKYITSLKI